MRQTSEATALLRIAIEEVLANATRPMTSTEIAQKPSVCELGATTIVVSQMLKDLYGRKTKLFPIARTWAHSASGSGRGAARWDYYNPKVVQLVSPARPKPQVVEAPPVNAVNPPEFQFDPVAFVEPGVDAEVPVSVPAGVKTITLTVGGVSIKIEIGGVS